MAANAPERRAAAGHTPAGSTNTVDFAGYRTGDRLFFSPEGQWIGFMALGKLKKI